MMAILAYPLLYELCGAPVYVAVLFTIRGQVAVAQSHPSGAHLQLPVNVATAADLEQLKRELTTIMRSEIAAAKHDILDGISVFFSVSLPFLLF